MLYIFLNYDSVAAFTFKELVNKYVHCYMFVDFYQVTSVIFSFHPIVVTEGIRNGTNLTELVTFCYALQLVELLGKDKCGGPC